MVRGARGKRPTEWIKCTAIKQDGYRIEGALLIPGHEARKKALLLGEALIQRANRILKRMKVQGIQEYRIETPGAEAMFGYILHLRMNELIGREGSRMKETREVVLRIAAAHQDRRALDVLGMELAYVRYSFVEYADCVVGDIDGSGDYSTDVFRSSKSISPIRFIVPINPPLRDHCTTNHLDLCVKTNPPRPRRLSTALAERILNLAPHKSLFTISIPSPQIPPSPPLYPLHSPLRRQRQHRKHSPHLPPPILLPRPPPPTHPLRHPHLSIPRH